MDTSGSGIAGAVQAAVQAADIGSICEALQATQMADPEARKKAEQQLDDAAKNAPNKLIGALCQVLASSSNTAITEAIRQEAAVILRQLVVGLASRESVWFGLEKTTHRDFMAQVLQSMEHDPSTKVRRAAGQLVAAITSIVADDFEEVQKEWPEVLSTLSRLTGQNNDAGTRVVALNVLTLLVPKIGEGMMTQGNHAVTMLAGCMSEQPPQVGAAGVQLMLELVEDLSLKQLEPVAQVMPAALEVLKTLSNPAHEELLKDTLESLIQAVEAASTFFKDSNSVEGLSEILLKICAAGAQAFTDEDVRHSAMEAVMGLVIGLAEDVAEPAGLPLLETVVGLNIAWMFEVEEDVDLWTNEGREKDEDDCDDDVVDIGEENLDRLAENFDEEVLMPIIFKVIRGVMQLQDATWKTARSAVMALAQVVEHLEEETWVDQCVEFIIQHLGHAHPRVRYVAFWAVGQVCYDQSPHVQASYCETLLPAIVTGIDDQNIRVATAAVSAFSALGDELDCEDLEPQMDDLLMRLFNRLHAGESQAMQENCLSGIAVIAEVSEEMFMPYYPQVMPMLKQVITTCTSEDQRSLHGKAFECIACIGSVVGKEAFLDDAREVMAAVMPLAQNGFEADDPRREAFHEATGKIATTLGKEFKPYVEALLPSIFKILDQKDIEDPEDDDDDDDDDDDLDDLEGLVGKSSVLQEMEEALELTETLIDSLGEEFCDFLAPTCQKLLPMLDNSKLLQPVFKTWGCIAECARAAATSGRIQPTVLQELVTELLKKTVMSMMQIKPEDLGERVCARVQAQAAGVAGVIKQAGQGVLSKEGVKDVAAVIMQLLDRIQCPKDGDAEPGVYRRRGGPVPDEDSDGDEKEPDDDSPVTMQSVRFSLCDLAGALMRSNQEDFVEVAMPTFMEVIKMLVKQDRSEGDRCLGFYLADDIVACLGERTVPHWNGFMNEALMGMLDKSPVIRQFATSTIGRGAHFAAFAQVAPAAAAQVHKVLQKHGERHRRRRAVKTEQKQLALAVDACIHTLGQICETHSQQLGPDAPAAWAMWLKNLPLKYNNDAGLAAHMQLVAAVLQNHPVLTATEQLPRVLSVFADIYKNKNISSSELDAEMAKGIANLSQGSTTAAEGPLKELCSAFPERQKKKVEQMLKSTKASS